MAVGFDGNVFVSSLDQQTFYRQRFLTTQSTWLNFHAGTQSIGRLNVRSICKSVHYGTDERVPCDYSAACAAFSRTRGGISTFPKIETSNVLARRSKEDKACLGQLPQF